MALTEMDVDLRLGGKVISRFCMDTALTLEVLEKDSRTVIRIGGKMKIEHREMRLNLSGEDPTQAREASLLLGKTFEHAVGRKDGSLDIGFTDGTTLIVPVDPDYEPWEISATDGFMAVSVPGGGLTTWSPRHRHA